MGTSMPQKRSASRLAGVSTASLGKHDQRLPDEQPHERTLAAKRRKFAPVTESGPAEAARSSAMVDAILRKRGAELVDVDRAVRHAEAQARAARHAEKQSQQPDGRAGKPKGRGRGRGRDGGKAAGGKPAKGSAGGRGRGRGRGRPDSGPGRPPGKQGKAPSKRGRR